MEVDTRPKSRLWLIAYDVSDDHRRARVALSLEAVGRRVQYSVFECRIGTTRLEQLRARLERIIDSKTDSVRFYPVCRSCRSLHVRQGLPSRAGGWDRGGYYLV